MCCARSFTHSPWRVTLSYAVVRNAVVGIVFGGAPCGATTRATGVPKLVRVRHAVVSFGASCRFPYGVAKR
eukprot:31025-Pyramimonas_sp.AAC.1